MEPSGLRNAAVMRPAASPVVENDVLSIRTAPGRTSRLIDARV